MPVISISTTESAETTPHSATFRRFRAHENAPLAAGDQVAAHTLATAVRANQTLQMSQALQTRIVHVHIRIVAAVNAAALVHGLFSAA